MWLALLLAAQLYGPQQLPPVADADDPLVDAAVVVPGLIVDLAYATSDNIVGRALYPADSKCLLRGSVAQRLAMAADALRKRGFRLVARDCTRSLAAQEALFAAQPPPGPRPGPAPVPSPRRRRSSRPIRTRARSRIPRAAACMRGVSPSTSSWRIWPARGSRCRPRSTHSARTPPPQRLPRHAPHRHI